MKAVVISEPGNPDVLKFVETDKPKIGQGNQLLIRLLAAGINPIDTKIRINPEIFPIDLPLIPGFDGAGIVEASGTEVTEFVPGDEVYFCHCGFHGQQGCYAEYVVVDRNLVARKPKALSFQEAAAVPLVLITAWEALFDRTAMQPDTTLLIPAGAGGVGHVALQFAKHAGVNVCTTVSCDEKSKFVKQLGADCVINYKRDDVVKSVMDWTHGKGVDTAFDTIGGEVFGQCLACTKNYGDVVTILQPPTDMDWSVARLKNLRISLEMMLTPALLDLPMGRAHHGDILRKCGDLFDAGKLTTHIEKTFQLREASLAHSYLENFRPSGKIVLDLA